MFHQLPDKVFAIPVPIRRRRSRVLMVMLSTSLELGRSEGCRIPGIYDFGELAATVVSSWPDNQGAHCDGRKTYGHRFP